jgi:hypothetical protein
VPRAFESKGEIRTSRCTPLSVLSQPVGVGTDDLERRRLDAGLLARALLEELDLEAVLLGPAHVKAQQHLRPVLRFRSARPRVDLDIGIVAVGLARQQRLEPALLRGLRRAWRSWLGSATLAASSLRLAELEQGQRVVELAHQPLDRADAALELRLLAQGRLRLGLVGPQRRVGGGGRSARRGA